MNRTIRDYQRLVPSDQHVTEYYQELFAAADTNILDTDTVEVQLQKLGKQGAILSRIIDLAQSPGYRDVNQFMADLARKCEGEICAAVISGRQPEILRLAVIREGVVQFFDAIEKAAEVRQNVIAEITELSQPEKDDPSLSSEG
jgi:hypothetical protein